MKASCDVAEKAIFCFCIYGWLSLMKLNVQKQIMCISVE